MLNMVRPRFFVPIHGEYRHLKTHAGLARKQGIAEENIFILQNGDVLEISEEGAGVTDKVTAGRVFIDGKGIGDVEEMVLRDRRRLGHDGIVIVLLTVDKEYGKLVGEPDIISRGFILEDEYQEVIDNLRVLVTETLVLLDREIASDPSLLKAKIRSTLKKHFRNSMDRRPMIMPLVFEV